MSATPRLRVLAGPSPSHLTDISALVNTARAHTISSALFSGRVVVHVRGFPGAEESEYFEREERRGVTWSIQVQGRFLHPYSADDVLFGNTFDRPLKLPWGSSAALKFMNFIDPTLEHDLNGPRPWALSPLIATMPYFAHERIHDAEELPLFPTRESITDDTAQLVGRGCGNGSGNGNGNGNGSGDGNGNGNGSGDGNGNGNGSGDGNGNGNGNGNGSGDGNGDGYRNGELRLDSSSKRRAHFADAKNRHQITFGPEDILTTDFCYGFLSFPSLALNLPGGISFDLKRYWDGQPVRFVCVERGGDERTFWCVVFEADAEG